MATPPSKPVSNASAPRAKSPLANVSSSGQTIGSVPLTTRLNRTVDTWYNFFGLYIVSLLSLDPYSAAQNSRFNTRGPGRPVQTSANTAGRPGGPSTGTSSWFGGGRTGGSGPGTGGGAGGGTGGGSGRRMGTVDDVRGPECGSCG